MRLEPSFDVSPPELPSELIEVPPVTFLVAVEQAIAGRAATTHHMVSQTSDRVHVSQPNRREWLFERHAKDARRVSGFLCHHDTRTIVVYEAFDLLGWLDIRGWFDVVAFTGHRGALGRLLPAPEGVLSRVVVEGTLPFVNPVLLAPPQQRFPDYRTMDLGEWFTG